MRPLLPVTVIAMLTILIASCGNSTDSPSQYKVTLEASPSNGGSVTPTEKVYDMGSSAEISASANTGWRFAGWQGDYGGSSSSVSITMDRDKQITATFARKSYPLTIDTTGRGNVDETVVQAKGYEHGTTVELTAIPNANWRFKEWQGALSNSKNPRQVTVNKSKQVTAVFEQRAYPLNVTIQGKGGVNEKVVQAKIYEKGTMVELSAYPATGWKFKEWQGDVTSTQNSVRLTVDNAKEATAIFERKSYPMNIAITGNGSVSADPDQAEYLYGEPVELTAIPDANWKFVEWTADTSATGNPITVSVDSTMNLTAKFIESFYLASNGVTIICSPADIGDTGTINGVTYTKRSASQITPSNASTTCTSGITDMNNLFYNALSFNGNISHWDVSNVTSMWKMFSYATDFNKDLNSWDVSNVTTMNGMFQSASSFNGDITGWEVTNVNNMYGMFLRAKAFNQDIGDWKVGSVADMGIMFMDAENFDQDLSGWCVSGSPNHGNFATGAGFDPNDGTNDANDAGKMPVWGTCPSP